jgi:hypothetical protein
MLNRAAQHKQTFTRCVHHGNLMNKRGMADHFQNSARPIRSPGKPKKFHFTPFLPQSRSFGDHVVRAPAPVEHCSEFRYTLPNTNTNANIYDQIFWRSTDQMQDVLHELKSYHKIHSFAVDNEHEIEVIA